MAGQDLETTPSDPGQPGSPEAAPSQLAERDIVQRLLATVRHHFSMDAAWVATAAGGRLLFEWVDQDDSRPFLVTPGDSVPLADSFGWRIATGDLPGHLTDCTSNPLASSLPATQRLGIGSYVGAPIRDEVGHPTGVVCCTSRSTSEHLDSDAERVLQLVGRLIRELMVDTDQASRQHVRVRERVSTMLSERRFHTVFQPIYSLRSRSIVGVEALTRFDDPPLRPDAWFADAESVGLGAEVELAVLERALEHLPALPPNLYMAVNASPTLVVDPRLHELVVRADAARIILEITEHAAIDDYASVLHALQDLRRVGVRVSVDDVGAGFSTFSHVLELSPQLLKIDLSIIRGIDTDPARQALAGAIVEVARQLGADLVAEGVETDAELRTVARIGISSIQGYLVSRPVALPLPDVVVQDVTSETEQRTNQGHTTGGGGQDLGHDVDAAAQFDLMMLHSPIGVCLVGLDGRFLRVNPALAAMLGHSRDELVRLTFQELTHPDDLEIDLRYLTQCLEGARTTYRLGKRYRRADGTHILGDLTVVLVRSPAGVPQFFISQIIDGGPADDGPQPT